MLLKLRALWHPEMYHGWGKTKKYFEGWYMKCVTADERYAIAFIPGISMDDDGKQHAFVQVMYGSEGRSAYHQFAASEFVPSTERFDLRVGDNAFSSEQLQINLPGVSGAISFAGNVQWPKMLGAPGIMGWFSYIPFMECFHGIVSMNHQLAGSIEVDGRTIDFTGGKGYIEKDWGQSFPRAYTWMQTNHFGDTPASLIASVAHIPFLGSHFIGFICGFWLENKVFRFATYTGAKKRLAILDDHVELSFVNPKTAIHIHAHRAPGTELISPLSGAMTGKISESLQAKIDVELLENGKRIFEGTGSSAGLEVCLPPEDPTGKILTD